MIDPMRATGGSHGIANLRLLMEYQGTGDVDACDDPCALYLRHDPQRRPWPLFNRAGSNRYRAWATRAYRPAQATWRRRWRLTPLG